MPPTRAMLQEWAASRLWQHRVFVRTFLFGVTVPSQDPNPVLPLIAGIPDVLERVAGFVGVLLGVELRRTRALGPAIAAIDWVLNDELGAHLPAGREDGVGTGDQGVGDEELTLVAAGDVRDAVGVLPVADDWRTRLAVC